ncbi:hypothetical protein CL617_01220 [archaeon]|nr:hypothetical protein [archaeon]|tara:strand:- start:11161 stop:11661 length:501 start_codon:yes stop_codon:yes gene_type:complete
MLQKITPELAEICGIHAGDGHLRKDNTSYEISGSIEEKDYYDKCIIPLFKRNFNLNLKGKFFPTKGTYGFSVTDKSLNDKLVRFGFPRGNKSLKVKVPKIILNSKNKNVRRSFLRGLFDTDGCISFSKKVGNKDPFKISRDYYPRIVLTTVSKTLSQDIELLLKEN